MNGKPILCLDFDGVCHSYASGWQGADVIPDPPVEGLFEFIIEANKHFSIYIYSTRSCEENGIKAMKEWFEGYFGGWLTVNRYRGLPLYALLHFPTKKPPAFVSLDDRVLTFTGEWPDVDTLINFKPWNRE